MADRQSYPSPTAAQTRAGAGPFYANGGVSPSQDGTNEPPHMQITGEMENINPELQGNGHGHVDEHQNIAAHSAEQLAQSVMSLATSHAYQHMPMHGNAANAAAAAAAAEAAAAAKARSKVSRACDECRRKKIRCDATTENETSSCTACKKSNQVCQFSRTPQKRGPSKGYIKELADRVSTLERERTQLGVGGGSPQPSGPGLNPDEMAFLSGVEGEPYSPVPTMAGQKRTHSVSEGGFNDHYSASGRGGFPPPEQVYLDDEAINNYHIYLHMTLPFLPRDPNILRAALTEASTATKDAFNNAFETTLRGPHFSPLAELTSQSTPKHAYELLVNSNWMDSANLLQLQALLLLLVDSCNRGAALIHGGQGKTPWEFLQEAVTKGKTLELFATGLCPPQEEPDTHYLVSRSIVLSMTILDAFLSLGNKKLGSALEPALATIWEQDIAIVGQRTYMLARMARILSRLAYMRLTDSHDDHGLHRPTRATGSTSKPVRVVPEDTDVILRLKKGDQDLLQARELPDDPVLQMAFWYTRAQIEVTYFPLATAQNILFPVRRIVELLNHMSSSPNPLNYHFAGFAAHLLFQLMGFTNTKEEASILLEALDSTLVAQVPSHDTQSFDAGIRDAVSRKRSELLPDGTSPTMGLEHLANAAVGNTKKEGSGGQNSALQAAAAAAVKAAQQHMNSVPISVNFDGALLSQDGYLTALLVGA